MPVEILGGRIERLSPTLEITAYFTVSEALTNVAKYARATHATVRLEQEDGALVIEVADDGVGGAQAGAGSGLSGLADRVGACDGTLSVTARRARGRWCGRCCPWAKLARPFPRLTRGSQMTLTDRREFLRRTGLSVAGLMALSGPLQGIFARGALAVGLHRRGAEQRRLRADRPVARPGRRRRPPAPARGVRVPQLHADRHADERRRAHAGPPRRHGRVLAGPSRYRLVRNHEVNGPVGAFGNAAKAYDGRAGGGTITLEVNQHATKVESWVSCNGTQMNCAGGATPWGSWLTCEETVNGPDVGNDFTGGNNSLLEQKHGYVFEVAVLLEPGRARQADADPLRRPVRARGGRHRRPDGDPLR